MLKRNSTSDPDQSDLEVVRKLIHLKRESYTIIFISNIVNKNNKNAFYKKSRTIFQL